MIIITPGISRDATGGCRGGRVGRNLWRIYGRYARRYRICSRYGCPYRLSLKIIERENYHRFRFRQNLLRIASLFCTAREVTQFPALAAVQPLAKLRSVFRSIRPRKAAKVKSQLPCQRYNLGTD